ncbi:MAG TPA: A/G-specific adenine glycosylase [Actinomycetota bacterium]|nr:A/G-specific adenine glycosylase [Actinomycetota bacterium]
MLQQTQASRVEPIFEAFLARFPEVGALAGAPRAEVIRAWDGLGYNRRAVALHEAARVIVRAHGGRMPRDPELLRGLPGVGPYTAAAVASIGFGDPVPALDTNVRRVVARVVLGRDAADVPRRSLEAAASSWLDPSSPADWNQAVMDLGRLVCRPAPRCAACPLAATCRFRRSGARPRSPVRRQAAFEGSDRQVRGAIVRALRAERSLDVPGLSATTGHDSARIGRLIEGLVRDGLVERTRSGRVRLPAR